METNTTDTVVEINNLSYKVGTRYILKDINWSVKRGEHWVIFGMNGSGKTTLLSIIAGFQHYTDGNVKISGLDYIDPAVKTAHKK